VGDKILQQQPTPVNIKNPQPLFGGGQGIIDDGELGWRIDSLGNGTASGLQGIFKNFGFEIGGRTGKLLKEAIIVEASCYTENGR